MSENEADTGDERIIEEFIIRKRRRNLTLGLLLLFLALGLPSVTYFIDGTTSEGVSRKMGVVLIILFFACLAVFEFINWRCPLCKRYLGKSDNPVYCPHCSTRLKY